MRIVVTGCAGFIGSSLTYELLAQGHEVLGIDKLDNLLYPAEVKEDRLLPLLTSKAFQFHHLDILDADTTAVIRSFKPLVIVNEAGLPGQLLSWSNLEAYTKSNLEAAYRLGQIAIDMGVEKFIQASTSSVYGSKADTDENGIKNPNSPYGVTKLAAEQILSNIFEQSKSSLTVLRYFSVYGPNQRPDMGMYKFIESALQSKPITVYGNGSQVRDFTFIDDVVSATIAAIHKSSSRSTFNISGGEINSVSQVLKYLMDIHGEPMILDRVPQPLGDQIYTKGITDAAHQNLNWKPKIDLLQGIKLQYEWQKARRKLVGKNN
jgi:UDP-glucuronate 4-epimerase